VTKLRAVLVLAIAAAVVSAFVVTAQADKIDCRGGDLAQAQDYQPTGCKKKKNGFKIVGTRRADNLIGSNLDDSISGLAGNDKIRGGDGEDSASGGPGNDGISLGDGDDKGSGGSGKDSISGGDGDDTINVKGGGSDKVTCGTGDDTVKADRRDSVAKNCESVK
jgi:Ca2+-binding RTX toxin-like protein